jgi:tetratricopeptide (TPR) repeat protein
MVYDLDLMALSRLFEGFEFTTLKISAINFLGKKIKGSPFTPKNFKQFKVVGQKDMPIQAEIKMKSIVNRFLVEVGGVDEINRPFHLSGYLSVKFDDSLTWMVCESYGDDYAFIKGAEPVAASYYHRALQLDSSNAILCAKMGSALNGMGQFDKAARFYERSLEIDPMNIDTLNNYEICLGNLQLRVKHKAILADPTRAFDEPIVHSYQRSQRTIHDQKAFSKRMKTDQVIQKEVSFFEQYAE